ncbi:hypothetical protein [Prosthecobacter sp.]|uniref:hypothetical protein n=1 Tax=Prosthecobacter sp. TaxID=1965333 RepID=UPI0025FF7F09|nr:hypothetical protein [Prosthecobacter sp.]
MHPEYQRYLRRRLIRRCLLFGVLPLLLLLFIVRAAFTDMVAPQHPWIGQLAHLRSNHRFFIDYHKQHGRWPTTFADLSSTVADSPDARKPQPFVDPDTHQPSPWLYFDPARTASLPEYGHLIAAAPRAGGYGKFIHQNGRLVMFENGVVTFIPEPDFLTATHAR